MDSSNIAIIFLTIAVIICAIGLYKLDKIIETEIKPIIIFLANLSPLGKIPELAKNHDEEAIKELLKNAGNEKVKFHFIKSDDLFTDFDDEDDEEG